MPDRLRRRTPDEYLREAQAEETAASQGQLKIFLGYSSGVGKSFRMLDEARRRRERGQDVVVGGIQPRLPADVAELLEKLEVIPLVSLGQGTAIDLEGIVRRHPTVCVIDGLAYDNPPGAANRSRWQDVEALLAAGIKVIGSINIQYIAELGEQIQAITGKRAKETVPLSFIKSASEIEIVDAPQQSPNLARLRELALVLAADVVDHQLTEYLGRHGIQQQFRAQERILVCVTPRANIHDMLETALTIAERFHGELTVAYVNQPNLSDENRRALEEKLMIANAAGAHVEILEGADPAAALIKFAHARGITQLFIGHTQRSGFWTGWRESPIDKLLRLSEDMDVRVFPQ